MHFLEQYHKLTIIYVRLFIPWHKQDIAVVSIIIIYCSIIGLWYIFLGLPTLLKTLFSQYLKTYITTNKTQKKNYVELINSLIKWWDLEN